MLGWARHILSFSARFSDVVSDVRTRLEIPYTAARNQSVVWHRSARSGYVVWPDLEPFTVLRLCNAALKKTHEGSEAFCCSGYVTWRIIFGWLWTCKSLVEWLLGHLTSLFWLQKINVECKWTTMRARQWKIWKWLKGRILERLEKNQGKVTNIRTT